MREFCLIPLAQREPNIIEAALTYGRTGSTIEVFKVDVTKLALTTIVNTDTVKRWLFAEALKYIRVKIGVEGDIDMRWADESEYKHYVPPSYQPVDHRYWDDYEASIGSPVFHKLKDPPEPKPKEPTFMELLKAVE